METVCKECDKEFASYESVLRHLRAHKMTAQEYVLKWKHDGIYPRCLCGCGRQTQWNVGYRDFSRFVAGHASVGRVKSDEEKSKIGTKNAANMKKFMSRHPDIAQKRVELLCSASQTPEARQKRAEAVRRFWSDSPHANALRKDCSERALVLLSQNKIGPRAPFKTQWKFNPFTGTEEYMHSSWETAFLDACIERKYPVTKEHGITIPYSHPDGTAHTYVPDFYAFEDNTLYEVKGQHDDVDLAKWMAAAAWCQSKGFIFQVLLDAQVPSEDPVVHTYEQ